jgi:hypothetical protein
MTSPPRVPPGIRESPHRYLLTRRLKRAAARARIPDCLLLHAWGRPHPQTARLEKTGTASVVIPSGRRVVCRWMRRSGLQDRAACQPATQAALARRERVSPVLSSSRLLIRGAGRGQIEQAVCPEPEGTNRHDHPDGAPPARAGAARSPGPKSVDCPSSSTLPGHHLAATVSAKSPDPGPVPSRGDALHLRKRWSTACAFEPDATQSATHDR